MKRSTSAAHLAVLLTAFTPALAPAQTAADAVRSYVEAARAFAGTDHAFVFGRLCETPIAAVNAPPVTDEVPAGLPVIDPEREWYAEPAQVFDDLYFLGQTVFSAWALRTSEGIILVDAIFDYSVEAEVHGGLRKLGIDPAEIRYVIISHAHGDHSGGAAFLQQQGARIVMSETDWELYESSNAAEKATRDIVATDGFELTLGEATVKTYLTPGHTHGTISTILPVHDNGVPHVAAIWGGTLFNFRDSPTDPRDLRLRDYAQSSVHFQAMTAIAGADVILSNHTAYDGTTVKLPRLQQRQPGAAHPYVIGQDAVNRYFKVAESCAIAARIAEASGL